MLGSRVAAATSLDVGSTFFGTHGLVSVPGGEVHRDFPYTVTGVLEPTGTAQDRAIFGTLASVWEIHEPTSLRDRTALLADQGEREATSVLIRLETPGLRLLMADEIRERSDGIAAVPINEILRFQRGVIGPVQRSLLAIAAAVVAVACLTVLTTLHQAGERRRRDIAILRNLGAVRLEVAALVFIEGVLLTGTGLVLGLLLGHGGLALGSATVREATGLVLDPWHVTRPELLAVVAMALCGSLASLLPAITSPAHADRRPSTDQLSSMGRHATRSRAFNRDRRTPLRLRRRCASDRGACRVLGDWRKRRSGNERKAEGEPTGSDSPSVADPSGVPEITFPLLDQVRSLDLVEPYMGFPEALLQLDGKEVQLIGFMAPFDSLENMRRCMIVPTYVGCTFCSPPTSRRWST